jgi:hypothetical protein
MRAGACPFDFALVLREMNPDVSGFISRKVLRWLSHARPSPKPSPKRRDFSLVIRHVVIARKLVPKRLGVLGHLLNRLTAAAASDQKHPGKDQYRGDDATPA